MDRYMVHVARLGPLGMSPYAPGTVGSLAAVLVAPFTFMLLPLPWRAAVLAAVFVLGGLAAWRAEVVLGEKDPSSVVIDELFGQWLVFAPFAVLGPWEMLAGFGLFRVFDIAKPWPVRASEDWLPGGFGVMLDDGVAGVYAVALLALGRWAWPLVA